MSNNQTESQAVTGTPTWQERMPAPHTEYQCSMNCGGKRPCPAESCGDCFPVTVHGDPVAARDAEIADLRAQLASELQAKEYEQRHAVESEKAVAQLQAQLARQGQGFARLNLTGYSTAVNYSNGTSTPVAAQPSPASRAVLDGFKLKNGAFVKREARDNGGHGWLLYAPDGKLIRALDIYEREFIDCALAAAPSPAAQPTVEVKIERGRVWIVKGGQSFMLAYEPDEGDDPAEMQAYADNLRSVLSGFTPCVNSTAQPVAQVGEQSAALATLDNKIMQLQRKLNNTPIRYSSDRFDLAVEIDKLKAERSRVAQQGQPSAKGGDVDTIDSEGGHHD